MAPAPPAAAAGAIMDRMNPQKVRPRVAISHAVGHFDAHDDPPIIRGLVASVLSRLFAMTDLSREDPLIRSARREAIFAISLWAAALIYSVSFCYRYGYQIPDGDPTFVLGVPHWAFWGIFVPWTLCTIVSVAFALFWMRDDPLGEEAEDPSLAAQSASDSATAGDDHA
jgi:hypothetical protein